MQHIWSTFMLQLMLLSNIILQLMLTTLIVLACL